MKKILFIISLIVGIIFLLGIFWGKRSVKPKDILFIPPVENGVYHSPAAPVIDPSVEYQGKG